MSQKIIIIDSDCDCHDCYESESEIDVTVLESEDSIQNLIPFLNGNIDKLLKNETFIESLSSRGYKNIEALNKASGLLKKLPEYYVFRKEHVSYTSEIQDIDNINSGILESIVLGKAVIFQAIDPESLALLNPEMGERYKKAKQKLEKMRLTLKKAAIAKAKKKKEKEIKKAKELLAREGEI